jgi:hypothetical protein
MSASWRFASEVASGSYRTTDAFDRVDTSA